jgi:hypothetical protein
VCKVGKIFLPSQIFPRIFSPGTLCRREYKIYSSQTDIFLSAATFDCSFIRHKFSRYCQDRLTESRTEILSYVMAVLYSVEKHRKLVELSKEVHVETGAENTRTTFVRQYEKAQPYRNRKTDNNYFQT